MPWTNTQKQIAVRACKAARISDEQRRDMILRNFAHAKLPDGRITSTSPRMTNQDFEQFMAIVEAYAGGQLLHFSRDYFKTKAEDQYHRMRRRAYMIAQQLEGAGLLHANGAGLSGWISKRVTRGEAERVEDLDYHGLLALILSLSAYAHQNGVELQRQGMESQECTAHI